MSYYSVNFQFILYSFSLPDEQMEKLRYDHQIDLVTKEDQQASHLQRLSCNIQQSQTDGLT